MTKISSRDEAAKRIEQLESLFTSDLNKAKEELKYIAAYLTDSNLFPDREVLVKNFKWLDA